MDLSSLGMTTEQETSLRRKKVISAEALLRTPPLHYWDFREPLPLALSDETTKERIEKNIPFAVIGKCISFSIEPKDRLTMARIRIEEEKTKTNLSVFVMPAEPLKYQLLADIPEHPANRPVKIPEGIIKAFPIPNEGIKPKCANQITVLNLKDTVSVYALSELKTGGADSISRKDINPLSVMLGDDTVDFVRNYFKDGTRTVAALRWIARGLKVDLSIRKTICDYVNVKELIIDKRLIVGGEIRYSESFNSFSMFNPAVISEDIEKHKRIELKYSSLKGFVPDEYVSYVEKAMEDVSSFDIVPHEVLAKAGLPSLKETALLMHKPRSADDIRLSRKRACFDDLLYLAVKLRLHHPDNTDVKGPKMPLTELMERYIGSLPYDLTKGQRDAIDLLSGKMKEGKRAEALVQGDVGTGKTCVAFALMLQAVENGFQAALAVPYTTLAGQHYRDMQKVSEMFGLNTVLLTGDTPARERTKILESIKDGSANLIIGTHGIFTEKTEYKNLGLIIEDEEHKFGVIHRESFEDKGVEGCHKVTMSATPIPKSLAETLYGESSEMITITDKPEGRLPVKTAITKSDLLSAKEIAKQVRLGHQAYIVCPAIETGDKESKAASIEEKEKIYMNILSKPECAKSDGTLPKMAVLTGRMKPTEKAAVMESFMNGDTDILMATTVIEVGMNVPNATIIVITGSERFGFSTLHQLRGRVGRGKDQSYCVLQTDTPTDRLSVMTETNDGFEIAEKDLALRGPGSLFGEKQTGNNYFINLMLSYPKNFEYAKRVAEAMCRNETGKEMVRRYEEIYLAEELR